MSIQCTSASVCRPPKRKLTSTDRRQAAIMNSFRPPAIWVIGFYYPVVYPFQSSFPTERWSSDSFPYFQGLNPNNGGFRLHCTTNFKMFSSRLGDSDIYNMWYFISSIFLKLENFTSSLRSRTMCECMCVSCAQAQDCCSYPEQKKKLPSFVVVIVVAVSRSFVRLFVCSFGSSRRSPGL